MFNITCHALKLVANCAKVGVLPKSSNTTKLNFVFPGHLKCLLALQLINIFTCIYFIMSARLVQV